MQRLFPIQLLWDYGPLLATAFLTSVVLTPLLRRIALKRKIVDRPDDWLKPHKRPIPYLGGVAIFLGWALALLLAVWFAGNGEPAVLGTASRLDIPMLLGVIASGTLIMGLGLFDDLHLTSPRIRLVGTALIGVLLLVCGVGDRVAAMILPQSSQSIHNAWIVAIVSAPVSLFILVGACNATNMLDGMDGLCAGVLAVAFAGFAMLEVSVSVRAEQPPDPNRLMLALAMLGATLGFLPYNWNPARIFMGDAGSMLLGLNGAVLILMFADEGRPAWALGAVVVFGVPVADMCLTLIRRRRNGRPLMKGDRSHFYDQLVDRGFSVRSVAWISYAVGVVFAVLGGLIGILPSVPALVAFSGVVAAATVVIDRARMVRIETRPPPTLEPSVPQSLGP